MDDGLGHAGRHRNHTVLVLQGHFNLGPSAKEPAKDTEEEASVDMCSIQVTEALC